MKNWTLNTLFFDFRKPRVRYSYDGVKWSVCTKFDLMFYLKHINYDKYLFADYTFSYNGLRAKLRAELIAHKFPNVTFFTYY